jgi:hypothetical protein
MPAGCDFVCKNKDCKYYDTGFTVNAPWPLGDIDKVINSRKVSELKEVQDKLKLLKEEGREYASIVFPNDDNIETEGYRVQLWSKDEKCVWQHDVFLEGDESLESAIEKADLPKIDNYSTIVQDGIDCPSCDKQLEQNRWFTKEK